mmetsp:Transcript_22744/g.60968  ORF Transcript_22744/g.60968 Transcript_22744/m.60968 type:complete len:256 (-) Transcript_22744:181-948(-)
MGLSIMLEYCSDAPDARTYLSMCLRAFGYSEMFLIAPTASRMVGASDSGSTSKSTSGVAHGADCSLPCLSIVTAIVQPAARRRTLGERDSAMSEPSSGSSPSSIAERLPSGVFARFHSACSVFSIMPSSILLSTSSPLSSGVIPVSSASDTPRSSRSTFASAPSALRTTGRWESLSASVSVPTTYSACSSAEQPSRLSESESIAAAAASRTPASGSGLPSTVISAVTELALLIAMRPWKTSASEPRMRADCRRTS